MLQHCLAITRRMELCPQECQTERHTKVEMKHAEDLQFSSVSSCKVCCLWDQVTLLQQGTAINSSFAKMQHDAARSSDTISSCETKPTSAPTQLWDDNREPIPLWSRKLELSLRYCKLLQFSDWTQRYIITQTLANKAQTHGMPNTLSISITWACLNWWVPSPHYLLPHLCPIIAPDIWMSRSWGLLGMPMQQCKHPRASFQSTLLESKLQS